MRNKNKNKKQNGHENKKPEEIDYSTCLRVTSLTEEMNHSRNTPSRKRTGRVFQL